MKPLRLERKDDDDEAIPLESIYDEDAEQEQLGVLIERRYLSMLRALHGLIADSLGLDPVMAFQLRDEDTEQVLRVAAEQVVRIDETTRNAIRERLREGARLGLSNWEIANGSPKDNYAGIDGLFQETWRGRAATVARNELLNSQYVSSLNRYQASGLRGHIVAHDGDQDEPCAAQNGRSFPLNNPPVRQHVNCTLVPVFVVESAS